MKPLKIMVLLAFPVFSDSWFPPENKTFYSNDSMYKVFVEPKYREVFESKGCYATLFKKTGRKFKRLYKIILDNPFSPVDVLVDTSGRMVTLDNWHSMGYGKNVVVIYDEKGNLGRKYSLEEILSPEELNNVKLSVSSRNWRKGNAIFDNYLRILVDLRTGVVIKKINLRDFSLLTETEN